MPQVSFILMKSDLDSIRQWISEGSYNAAEHFLERPYITELITAEQQHEFNCLRDALAKEISKASHGAT